MEPAHGMSTFEGSGSTSLHSRTINDDGCATIIVGFRFCTVRNKLSLRSSQNLLERTFGWHTIANVCHSHFKKTGLN